MTNKYLLCAFITFLAACAQDETETPKIKGKSVTGTNSQTQQSLLLPDANDENCKLKSLEEINDKQIQRALADNCSKRSTSTKPPKHKPWVF
jgi:entry exclusion lipoprotein TrbK